MKKLLLLALFFVPSVAFPSGIYNPGSGSSSSSGGGDNLGSHIATMTVTANYGIVTTSVTATVVAIDSGTIDELWASTFSVTNPPNLMATIYSDGYGDVLRLHQLQYAGNYGDYLLFQQGNSVIWKIGTDMFDSNCSDGSSNCLHQPYIIKDLTLAPVFSFDQSHRMSAGKTWTPGVNYFNFNGNMSLGDTVDTGTAPVNGLWVTGQTIVGTTNAWALNTTAQMQIYGSPTNTYSLIVSTSLQTADLAVSTSGVIVLSAVPYRWPAAQASGTKILSNDGSGNLSWATDATAAGGGDNLGNHIATQTITASYGINVSTVLVNTDLVSSGTLRYNQFTKAQITSNQNDYALGTQGAFFRLTTDAQRTITGFANGSDGRLIIIRNAGSNNLALANDSASSTAANRILTGIADTLIVPPNQSVTLIYDAVDTRWQVL